MQYVAIVEEVVELIPAIARGVYATLMDDPEIKGLPLAQVKALIFLYDNGDRSLSEVAAGLAVSLPSASELIDRLIDRGLVRKTQDTVDRRKVVIALTEPAIAYGRRMHDLRRAQARAAIDAMPSEERESFLRAVRALAAALEPGAVAWSSPAEPVD
jgi:DNA-binding MarR family transcriptional regulator